MFFAFGLSQASDMMNAILEGYPKSKKEFLVRKESRKIYFFASEY